MYSVQIQVSCQISFHPKTLQFICESDITGIDKLEINTDKPETNNSNSAELPKQLPFR